MGQLQERYKHYREPQKYMEADVYPYFRAIEGKQGNFLVTSALSTLQRKHSTSMDQDVQAAASSMERLICMSSSKRKFLNLLVKMIVFVSPQASLSIREYLPWW